jgi:hypothetical protein
MTTLRSSRAQTCIVQAPRIGANHAMARRLRKLLVMKNQDLSIPSPCTADWRKMTPADGGRFCGDCKKVVRDLSTMRERDARTLLKSADNGELCVRYLYDKHGKVFFAGDAPPLVPASFLQRAKRVALSAAAVAVPLSLAACSPSATDFGSSRSQDELKQQELYENMGGVSAPEQPPARDAGPDAEPATDGGDAGVQEDGGADAGADAADEDEAEAPI